MFNNRGIHLLITLILVIALIGCSSKKPTISEEEQQKTREHQEEFEKDMDI